LAGFFGLGSRRGNGFREEAGGRGGTMGHKEEFTGELTAKW
jgi:hypothetical protein